MSELEYTDQGWRYTTDHHRHHRELPWDYRGRGIYHLTLVVAGHYPLFGALAGEVSDAHIRLNAFGRQVLALLRDEPRYYGAKGYAFRILASQIMPDHIHVVIQVTEPLPRSIGEVIRGFKSACTALYKRQYANDAATGGKYAAEMQDGSAVAAADTGAASPSDAGVLHFSRIIARAPK